MTDQAFPREDSGIEAASDESSIQAPEGVSEPPIARHALWPLVAISLGGLATLAWGVFLMWRVGSLFAGFIDI